MVGLGPAPFCAMMLADMGAEVIRIDQKQKSRSFAAQLFPDPRFDVAARGRRSLALDLKHPAGVCAAKELVGRADALIEGFRPGTMERLGLGPEICLEQNPRLVYGRMTGWGQTGPLATVAGHDINYIALTGALHAMGPADRPPALPLNLVGDYGGGAMMLAFGVVCGLLEAQRSGKGQVIDAAMTDGAALLASVLYSLHSSGMWRKQRYANLLDGGAHFYDTYVCADGKFISVGALEPQFYRLLCEKLGVADDPAFTVQNEASQWPELKTRMAALFAARTRDQWCELLEGTEACFAPVLDCDEAPAHPHNLARGTFIDVAGVIQPAPAPRFSRTPGHVSRPPPLRGEHSEEILLDWGLSQEQVEQLQRDGVI